MIWPTQQPRKRESGPPGRMPAAGGGPGAPQTPGPSSAMPPRTTWLTFAVILALNYFLMRVLFPPSDDAITIPYTIFKQQVEQGNVEEIYSQGASIEGRFVEAVTWPTPEALEQEQAREQDRPLAPFLPTSEPQTSGTFTTTLPAFVDPGLESFLIEHDVEISAIPIQNGSPWATLLFGLGPAILIIAFYVWLFRRAQQAGGMGSALMGIGKSKARRYDEQTETKVTFDDVAGIDEAENELVEIVDFLKDPDKYTRLGGTAPKGVLLVGAPGTGKTLLARAVAGEAGVPFFSMSAAEFVEMIVGVGAARVRDLFKEARKHAPAIIFIDEIDSIGRARGPAAIGGASEQEKTLNQILTEMDGFSVREGVIVLSATNQPDVLDKALLRPGRFDPCA